MNLREVGSVRQHLRVMVGPSQREGIYVLSLFATGTGQPICFQSFATLEEIEATGRGIVAAVKEQRRLESPDGIG
jgi:hypothetical protein